MNNNTLSTDANSGALIQRESSISLVDLLDNLFYFRWHFVVSFVVITCIAVIYAVLATPIYSADALIQVEERKGASLGALSQVASALGAQQSPVLGEIEIIRSRSVVGRAVDKIKANINVTVENRIPIVGNLFSRILSRDSTGLVKPLWENSEKAWGGEQLAFEELVVPPDLIGKPLTLIVGKDKAWTLVDPNGQTLAKGSNGGGLVVGLDGKLRFEIATLKARAGTRFRVVVFSIQSRVAQVLSSLRVIETKRQSNILSLTFESSNAVFASTMLNAIADAYLQQNIDRRSEEAELSLKFLNEELPKLRVKLDQSEKALNDFRSKSKTIDISSEIKELLLRATTVEKAQLELDLKKREYAERFDPAHPLMRALLSQIAGVKIEQQQLSNQISLLPSIEQDYIRLARDVQVNSQLYVSLLNNAQQLQVAKASTTGNVAIVDRAYTPDLPSRPRKGIIAATGALIGLFFGFAIAQILAFVSRIVRDPKKLEHETNLPTLAILPLDIEQIDSIEGDRKKAFLLAKEKPGAASVEALRSLRTALLFKLSEKPRSKVVLITSAVPMQGKSFVAVNLSYLLAATGKRVLLIEADIRLASLMNYIDFTKGQGLSNVLKDNIPVESVVLKNIYPNMDYLPSGPTVRNPGDLLAADAMNRIINESASIYDFVVIDSPPLLPVHDARSLGKAADVTLFIARQNNVSVTEIHDAIDVFNKSGNEIDGIVFNAFVPSKIRYGYGYGYGYTKYRGKYGGRYGNYKKYGE